MERVSVTEVRNALRCPRVFALGRLREDAVAFPVGSSCLGGAFHRIVERFVQTVVQPPAHLAVLPADASVQVRRDALTRWLLEFLVDELSSDAAYANMPAEVDDLAEALRELAAYLAGHASRGPLADAVRELVRAGERPVEAAIPEASVLLSGRIDGLHARAGGRVDVVEYKLTAEENGAVDRAQVALYRELLRRAEGVDANPVVLRFNPALTVTELPGHRADEFVRSDLVPLLSSMARWALAPASAPPTERRDLCAACPVAAPCAEKYRDRLPARDDPPMAGSRPRPTVSGGIDVPAPVKAPKGPDTDEDGRREADEIRRRILDELRRDGVTADALEATVGPTLYVIEVVRRRGPVGHLDRSAQDVEHRLKAGNVDATYVREGATRAFHVKRANPRTVLLAPLLEAKRSWLLESPGRFVLGQEPNGRVLTGDLADAATPHLLVGGQAGSGKSWLLRSVVASLVHWHAPSALRVTLIDPKRVTFNVSGFQSAIASHLDGPVVYGLEDAMACLERFVEIMEERYVRFEAERVSDLREYNDQAGPNRVLPRHVIVFDEFADLTVEKKAAAAFCTVVKRLGAKARAAGVHLVLATQRPDAQTVPPALKVNLGGKVALKVSGVVNSRIILDRGGAEGLLGKGDLMADLGQGIVRAQAAVVGA